MNEITCQRCGSRFYTVASGPYVSCPYCGYLFSSGIERRGGRRTLLEKNCDLFREDETITAQAVDLSKAGIGIRKLVSSVPFHVDDTLKVVIRDFDIETNARVVWVKLFGEVVLRAGLEFC